MSSSRQGSSSNPLKGWVLTSVADYSDGGFRANILHQLQKESAEQGGEKPRVYVMPPEPNQPIITPAMVAEKAKNPMRFVVLLFLFLPFSLGKPSLEGLFRRLRPRRSLQHVHDVSDLRQRISEHRIRLARLQQESRDLSHEKAFLEKALELKRGQKTMQDGQVKLSQAELEDKAKEIAMYKREAPRTLQRYNELVRTQREMQETLNRLHAQSEQLVNSKESIMKKIHTLSMGDLVERHARGLPDAMAGALRKSAAALVPFFDYLAMAADTNNRLVDHVGKEIDRYTHVNIAGSPFMSGVLFYCVVLIPVLAIITLMRRLFNSSSRLTANHFVILGNFYFFLVCILNVLVVIAMKQDPVGMWFERHERTFVLANLFLALYYIWHVGVLVLQSVITLERRNVSQLLATLSIGIHYFLFTWQRVFTDTAPKMYTFNYMMYGTIFAFILYERLNRLSSRQLNSSASFRFVHRVFMFGGNGKGGSLNLGRLKQLGIQIWAALTMSSKLSRRYPRPYDRKYVSDKQKYQTDDRDRQKIRYVQEDSEEDDSDAPVRRRSPTSRDRRRRQGNHRGREQESRGFISIFFGNRDNNSESSSSSSSESDDPRHHHAKPSGRSGRSGRKNRGKESARWGKRSIWKWS